MNTDRLKYIIMAGFVSLLTTATPLMGVNVVHAADQTTSHSIQTSTSWYVAGKARGNADGTSRSNAAYWRNVNKLNLQPGDIVNFLTDVTYPKFTGNGVILTKSGTAEEPILFRGVGNTDSTPACAWLSSDRADPYRPPSQGGAIGGNAFTLDKGANNLHFNALCGRNIENFYYVKGSMVNNASNGTPLVNTISQNSRSLSTVVEEQAHPLTIMNGDFRNVRRVYDMTKTAQVVNGWFERIRVIGVSKNALRFYNSDNNVIQNIYIDGAGNDGDHFQSGVVFQGDTAATGNHDNLIRNATIKNIYGELNSSYTQGDAVDDEEYDSGTRIESSTFTNLGDAGTDLKGANDVVVDVNVASAKRSFRHHHGSVDSSLSLIRVKSSNPVAVGVAATGPSHVWASAPITIIDSTFTNSDKRVILKAEGKGARITIAGSKIITPAGTNLISAIDGAPKIDLDDTVVTYF